MKLLFTVTMQTLACEGCAQGKYTYWREYYLAKHVDNHFGEVNINDLDKTQ